MAEYNNIFEKFLFEASGDDPPDIAQSQTTTEAPPPDIPEGASEDPGPPDIPDTDGGFETDDAPPDLSEDNEFGSEDGFEDDLADVEDASSEENLANLGLDEKISAIMNMNLYQRFLALLNNINSQLAMVKDNSDILYSISPDSLDISEALKKLDENVHLYLKNNFINENYSKNILFFNKCLNLLKLLNDSFDDKIKKGIKTVQ